MTSRRENSSDEAARRYALAQRTLKCPDCGSYEVISKGRELNYVCCKCGRKAEFAGWVRVRR
jgi:tRNA(Ile2) C34 agmatinyltransferase TiaS